MINVTNTSEYYTINKLNNYINDNANIFSILHIHISSFNKNIINLINLLEIINNKFYNKSY